MHNTEQEYRFLSEWNPLDQTGLVPKIQVVTVFLQNEDKILVLQRARNDLQHKLWGIPGGKLDNGEDPIQGLCREVLEETTIDISGQSIQLLGTALSRTPCDGQYGLYLYHLKVSGNPAVKINQEEHYDFKWLTLDEFKKLNLLTAQREAFLFVESKLIQAINS